MSADVAAGGRLIGRTTELARLRARLEHAGSGGAQRLLIEGEPGIGKSALVRAAAEEARSRGLPVCVGRGDELAAQRSFCLLADQERDQPDA